MNDDEFEEKVEEHKNEYDRWFNYFALGSVFGEAVMPLYTYSILVGGVVGLVFCVGVHYLAEEIVENEEI